MRIERDATEPRRRVVAELERRPAVRGLVQGDGEQHRYHPDRCGEQPCLDHRGATLASKVRSARAGRRPRRTHRGACCTCEHAVEALPRAAARASARTPRRPPFRYAFRCNEGPGRSRPRAAAAARAPTGPVNAPMDRSSLTSSPSKPIAPRTAVFDHGRGERTRPLGVERGCSKHGPSGPPARRAARERGTKSRARSAASGASTCGSTAWLSLVARPWPGMCLTAGTIPPACKPSATARPSLVTIADRHRTSGRRRPCSRRRSAGPAPARS